MKMSGEQLISASRETVWAALNDPAILKQSIAGCTELDKTSATEFAAKVTAKVGPVKAKFVGDVKLSKLKPPESYVISGQGKGGAAGFAKGGATVKLEEKAGQTLLTYDVDAQVGGKLAQIGSRLIQSTARKMADDFFKRFAKLVAEAPVKPAAKKSAAKKSTAKKAAAKKTATKKSAAGKTATKKTAAPKARARTVLPRKSPAKRAAAAPASAADSVDAAKSPVSAAVPPQPAQSGQSGEKSGNAYWLVGGIAIGLVLVYFLAR